MGPCDQWACNRCSARKSGTENLNANLVCSFMYLKLETSYHRYVQENGVHVLGICYGMQLLVQKLGGEVTEGEKQEYGKMEIEVAKESALYDADDVGGHQTVWMSHGDEAVRLPDGFEVVARSTQGTLAGIEDRTRRFYGLQYHPEVLSFCLEQLHLLFL